MMEKWKSLILVALVAGSLMQSYILAYSKPNFIPIRETEYIRPELTGTEKEMDELMLPNDIVLHFGENRHTILYPQHYFYKEIMGKLTKRTFDGFIRTEVNVNDLYRMRNDKIGLEIAFPDHMPFFLLQRIFQIRGAVDADLEAVNRIWITTTDMESEVKAYFFTSSDAIVYEATRVDLTISDLTQYVTFGSYMNEKSNDVMEQRKYYIPEMPVHMPAMKLHYDLMTPQQLQNSLFVDPSISRNLLERDGTEIFTDGKRGLQINRMKQWMSYSDPVVTAQQRTEPSVNFQTVIQFVNQHGGWNSEYTIEQFPKSITQTYTFRQRYGSYPILPMGDQPIGYISVTLEKGVVTHYERSLIRLGAEIPGMREKVILPGGDDLRALLRQVKLPVQDVFPAYRAIIGDEHIQLVPGWGIELYDGTYSLLGND